MPQPGRLLSVRHMRKHTQLGYGCGSRALCKMAMKTAWSPKDQSLVPSPLSRVYLRLYPLQYMTMSFTEAFTTRAA